MYVNLLQNKKSRPKKLSRSVWNKRLASSQKREPRFTQKPDFVGEITRRGYRIEWFIGDHGPRHVHVYEAKERFLGRLDIERMRGLEGWKPSRKLIKVIEELRKEGRL